MRVFKRSGCIEFLYHGRLWIDVCVVGWLALPGVNRHNLHHNDEQSKEMGLFFLALFLPFLLTKLTIGLIVYNKTTKS